MKNAASTVVDGLSAFIAQIGQRQMRTRLVNVGSEVCVAIPATFIQRRAGNQERRTRRSTVVHEADVRAPQLAVEQQEYLSAWQSEMESFDRF